MAQHYNDDEWLHYQAEVAAGRLSISLVGRSVGKGRAFVYRRFKDLDRRKAAGELEPKSKVLERIAGELSADQTAAVQYLADGLSHKETASAVGTAHQVVSRWHLDPAFRKALGDLRAERRQAVEHERVALAQRQFRHLGNASNLANRLVDNAIRLMDAGPPAGYTPVEIKEWYKAVDAAQGRALEAGRLLASIAPTAFGVGGYPKTDRLEVAKAEEDPLDNLTMEELMAEEARTRANLRLIKG